MRQNIKEGLEEGSGLMGAEERFRWRGSTTKTKIDPPCRCKYCKKANVIRIDH